MTVYPSVCILPFLPNVLTKKVMCNVWNCSIKLFYVCVRAYLFSKDMFIWGDRVVEEYFLSPLSDVCVEILEKTFVHFFLLSLISLFFFFFHLNTVATRCRALNIWLSSAWLRINVVQISSTWCSPFNKGNIRLNPADNKKRFNIYMWAHVNLKKKKKNWNMYPSIILLTKDTLKLTCFSFW